MNEKKELEQKMNNKFSIIIKHILYSVIWICLSLILFFRIDLLIIPSSWNFNWIMTIIPLSFIIIVFFILFKQKWYNNIAFILYPILAPFWFIPKFFFKKGKMFFLIYYINGIFLKLKNFKISLFNLIIFCLIFLLLLSANSQWIKIFSIMGILYLYINYLCKYVLKLIKPSKLFSLDIEGNLNKFYNEAESNKYQFIEKILDKRNNEAPNDSDYVKNQLTKLYYLKATFDYMLEKLNGIKSKQAFIVTLIYEYVLFIFITILTFSFINYQLFLIDNSHFKILGDVNFFNFLYYTIKCITQNSIELIKPISWLAQTFDVIISFFIGSILLILILSFFILLRHNEIDKQLNLTSDIFNKQNNYIIEYTKNEFGRDFSLILNEFSSIKESYDKIMKVVSKFL